MASTFTDDGEEWASEIFDQNLGIIAVGTGSSSPTEGDTALDNEIYRASTSDSNVSIDVGAGVGEVVCQITVSGGTEVPAGTTITEFGLYSLDGNDFLYREVPDTGTTVASGDRRTFEFELTVN